ncbi:membrane dipeptidase [Pacificimonas sp. WHA3]|uniref:Membrane dipeptidase n=1 Tax=Pacificimonas pallii TaxID=2827236 RepID=A0ABS6SCN1_9SPHN|nr:membrane dipeptidase [Pacificimonas pallii]MBV7255858.1 membrane dipeptidase [Pacificimonas pallii]
MDRRKFIGSGLALGAMTLPAMSSAALLAKTRPLTFDAMGEVRFNYTEELVREMIGSGLDAIAVTLCDPKPRGTAAYDLAMDAVLAHDRHIAAHPHLFIKATSVADIDRARSEGKLALYYLFQNSTHFGTDLDNVDVFYNLGVRVSQITYNHQNWAGAGCKELGAHGLTRFGRELVERMNARGMLIDLSHANMRTMADAIEHSKVPVSISHTACMAVHANERNTTDANLRLLAERGGVVGICQIRPFLTEKRAGALADYFRHIDHAINVAGVDHVAIGSDRDHRRIKMTDDYLAELKREEGPNFNPAEWPLFIDELNGPNRMEVVWDGVRKLGHGEAAAEKIMGTNLRRLYTEVVG